MYLTAYQSGEDIIAYEEDKRLEVVTTFAGEGKITRRKNHALKLCGYDFSPVFRRNTEMNLW